jgi:hypothetical protein
MVLQPVYVGYSGTCSLYNTMLVKIIACRNVVIIPMGMYKKCMLSLSGLGFFFSKVIPALTLVYQI